MASNIVNEYVGVAGFDAPAPIAPAPIDPALSHSTFAPDQSVFAETFYTGPFLGTKAVSDGFLFLPGDNAGNFVGPGDLANHINYMISLIPEPYGTAGYFEGEFTNRNGVPSNSGRFDGLVYSAVPVPVPVPAALWFLASALSALGLSLRRT